jgi:4-amino-4-deoxy-L-arabinose transferase-like glycosyltransferase
MTKMGRTLPLLLVVLLAYLGIAGLFAIYTPPWQVPDEPAHYNYVRTLAETGAFPVLQMGDYPHEYLEEIKARRFPGDLSIDPIRYESHQPPLYYLLATPVFRLACGALVPLRWLSVILGALLLWVAYRIVRTIFAAQPALAIAVAAFVGFVPMHVAMAAGVENDTLAELLLALVAWRSLVHLAEEAAGSRDFWWRLVATGILLGLVLVTKTTAYGAVVVALVAVVWRWALDRPSLSRPWGALGCRWLAVFAPALAMALPWYVRNIAVYGWPDALGLRWHNAVVLGQPRTAEWIASNGWWGYLERFVRFTFQSFWGVFGWMGVFLDNRIYQALALLSLVWGLGLLVWAVRWASMRAASTRWEQRDPRRSQSSAGRLSTTGRQLVLLAVWVGWTLLQYLGYNVTFVQHQGRYLFPALIPIGLGFALGWQEILRPVTSRWVGALLALITLALAGAGLLIGDLPVWLLGFCAMAALGLLVRPWLPRRLDSLVFVLPFAGLALLDLVSLFVFIRPGLA